MEDGLQRVLFDPTLGRLITVALILVVVVAVVRLVQRAIAGRIRDTDARYRARKFVTFSGYVVALIVIVTVYSDRLTGLTVALGVAGAGVAFALQEIIASVAGWVALTFSRWYAPGDRIQLGGIKGDVIDIGILRTTLMEIGQWVNGDLYNGRIVRIANSFVFKEPVFNYSGDFPFLWDEIKVPIRYGGDRALAREILERVVRDVTGAYVDEAKRHWTDMLDKYRVEAATVEPFVHCLITDNWLEFTVRYVVDYRRRRATKDRLSRQLLDEFDATQGKVQLASATFEVVGVPPVTVTTPR